MRGKKRNWVGVKQGRLTILCESGRDSDGNVLWECVCDCGARCVKPNKTLAAGVKSCSIGCGVSLSNTKRVQHGHAADSARSTVYRAWVSIKQRCLNPNNSHYHRYGGRGVTICDRWLTFKNFLEDVGFPPESRLSIDRINNNRGYEKGNVRWATKAEQSNNREVTLRCCIDGVILTLSEAASLYGVNYMTVFQRHKRGLQGKDLVTPQPLGRKPKSIKGDQDVYHTDESDDGASAHRACTR